MPPRLSRTPPATPSEHEPQIALAALTRLRWLAVVGQLAAAGVAVFLLGLRLPIGWVAAVVALTAVSNAWIVLEMRRRRPPRWRVQSLLVLDVAALTALLYLTGGAGNPFAVLYLVHVAMAVMVLGFAWTWVVVAMAAACYAALFWWHLPLDIPPRAMALGQWFGLVLVAVLIAVFIGRVDRSLRDREQELIDVRERAGRNEQLAALTTLAAGAAHELNTPLGTIAVVAKELEVVADRAGSSGAPIDVSAGGGMDTASIRDDARLIRQEVDRCRAIISRLRLDIEEDLAPRGPVAVVSMVKRLRAGLRAEEAARLRVLIGSDVETVPQPARALEQALAVLLRNAFDASPGGVGGTAAGADAAAGGVTLSIQRREGRLRIEVEDRGTGMSDELLRHAGEPFFTTKEPGKGMGLGLYLVRLVADRYGGEFSIHSKLGEGTRCVLELPEERRKNVPARRDANPPPGEARETHEVADEVPGRG
jgi:two-component system sensor histidine kinase RegB